MLGYYYWKKGSDFVKYAEQMIEQNSRTNGEFYVSVYNWLYETERKQVLVWLMKYMNQEHQNIWKNI